MYYFGIFLFEFLLLFFLSKKLIKSLALIIFRISHNHKVVVNTLAVIFLPGTIMHELSHLLFAGIMLVPVGEMAVVPEILEDEVKLGSVQIGKVDPFRLTLVGVAPVILGGLSIIGLLYFAQIYQDFTWWKVFLGLYLIFEISNTMFSSKKDIEGTIGFVLAIVIVAILLISILYFWRPLLIINIWNYLTNLNFDAILNFFRLSSLYLLVPLILDISIILLTKPFTKTKQLLL